jgi:hypothetical protein
MCTNTLSPAARALQSVKKMMDRIEANYTRDDQINRYDIVQKRGNDEDQDASQ